MTEQLNIKAEAEKLQKMYADDPKSKTFNGIIYGPLGTGKTMLLRSARRPLHVDSFDPGGTKVLHGKVSVPGWPAEYIDDKEIYTDTRFEDENPSDPKIIKLWDEVFHQRKRMGYFDRLGTYAIDTSTTWTQCIMYEVLRKAGRSGGHPFKQDWLPQMAIIENAMREFVSLPCDCILTGHDNLVKDDSTGKMFISLLITGKLQRRVPLLFDEIYYAHTKETSKGIEYQLLTRATGLYQARSRLGKGGELETYEKPDIKAILKKVGMDASDKPSLFAT